MVSGICVLFDISHQVCSHNKPRMHTTTEKPCCQGGSVGAWVGGCHLVVTKKVTKETKERLHKTSQVHPRGRRRQTNRLQARVLVHLTEWVGQQERRPPRCARQVHRHGSARHGNRTWAYPGGGKVSRQVTVVATRFVEGQVAMMLGYGKVVSCCSTWLPLGHWCIFSCPP